VQAASEKVPITRAAKRRIVLLIFRSPALS